MVNDMVPKDAEVVGSGMAGNTDTVNIADKYFGGESYIRYNLDKDTNVFTNTVTDEQKPFILARINEIHFERAYFKDGELLCSSRDAEYSKDGILCATCKNVNDSPLKNEERQRIEYEKACKESNIQNPEPWNTNTQCSLRLVVQWAEEFEKTDDGKYIWVIQPGICYISCPRSSILAMISPKSGYLNFLKSRGFVTTNKKHGNPFLVVTTIDVGHRKNEKMNVSYSYETFSMEGKYQDIIKKCINYNEIINTLGGAIGDISSNQIEQKKEAEPKTETEQHDQQPAEEKQVKKNTVTPKQTVVQQTTITRKATVAEQPTAPAQPEKTTPPGPSATTPDVKEIRLKVKFIYATLPADVKKIILNVLKVEGIEQIPDSDLPIAFETLQLAKEESAKQPSEPAQDSAGTPSGQSGQPEDKAPATATQATKKKNTPW